MTEISERAETHLPSNLPEVLCKHTLVRGTGFPPPQGPLSCVFAIGAVFLLCCPTWAETDTLMRMVGIALTGSDNIDLKVVGNRTDCVFAIKNDLFRLNNVYADRIKIQELQLRASDPSTWITVLLQGDEIVFEETVEPPKDDGSKLMREMRADNPDILKPHQYTYTSYELYLTTNDPDRVKSAWQYIYSHGCTGKQSRS